MKQKQITKHQETKHHEQEPAEMTAKSELQRHQMLELPGTK